MRRRERGIALVIALVVLIVVELTAAALIGYLGRSWTRALREEQRTAAYYIAEAGMEWAAAQQAEGADLLGRTTRPLGDGSFEVTVEVVADGRRIVSRGIVGRERVEIERRVPGR